MISPRFDAPLLAALVVALTLVRLAVAAVTPLAPDETYYWVWSQALAPGYLDHPPMVALWIRAGTILAGQTALGVRLLGPLSAALASWLLYDAARTLFPGSRAGAVAVVLLNATLLLGVGSVIMTPDTPLLAFWTAALWAAARLAAGGTGAWWLAAGLFGGLALDSKYTALFLWIGLGLWSLLVPAMRPWLRRWQPWTAGLLGLALFAPVLAWNAAHGWAGFLRQGGRVADWQPMRALGFLAELAGSQLGLATPLVFVLCMAALAVAARHAWRTRDPAWSLLAALSVPPVLVFLQHALGGRVQGNWPAIIYPALAVAAGGLEQIRHAFFPSWPGSSGPSVAARACGNGPDEPGHDDPGDHPVSEAASTCLRSAVVPPTQNRMWIVASVLGFAITGLAYLQAATSLLPLPPRLDPIAIRLAGWDALARQVEADGALAGTAWVTADGYAPTSELAWWLPPGMRVIGTDPHFLLTTLLAADMAGQPGLLLHDARHAGPPDPAQWPDAEPIGEVVRPGAPAGAFTVYRVAAAPGQLNAVVLPRRGSGQAQ